ncbi:hypothetical protein [Sphingomonas sp. Root710]|uniref:hypothetical protein n=1 Tax=Sphingomonas sp. Root710 TaxID=1736594 RepID=UPI000A57AB38|nr:hypothetical protein [Sphingomonas sp. Root710]
MVDVSERVFMISGTDANGDTEMFMSVDRERATAKYVEMVTRLRDVRKNDAWDNLQEN